MAVPGAPLGASTVGASTVGPSTVGASTPADPAAAGSARLRLARLAYVTALGVPGVVGTDTGQGGRIVTQERDVRVDGVLCVAAPGGGYEVALRLVCGLVPLHPLADAVRSAVIGAAAVAGLPLERVDVHIATVTDGSGA